MHYRPQFGSLGVAKTATSVSFVSQVSLEADAFADLGLSKRLVGVKDTRDIRKTDLVLNDALPKIEVDPATYVAKADGEELHCEPAKELPLAQRYFLF